MPPLSRRRFLSTLPATLSLAAATDGGPDDRYACRMFPEDPKGIAGIRHAVYTAAPSSGPRRDVIVMHEITGANHEFFHYADTLVKAGFTVHCPVFFGPAFTGSGLIRKGLLALQACHPGSEFKCTARNALKPLNTWLVALATDIAGTAGNRVGAVGMCLTGVQPLAMLRCRAVTAAVLCQPTLPFGHSEAPENDLGLAPSEWDHARARVVSEPALKPDGTPNPEHAAALLIRFRDDPISSRPRALHLARGLELKVDDTFIELEGHGKHSTLVHYHNGVAIKKVCDFLSAHI